MADLTLALLGAFEARRPRGAALALPKKTRALLAYLALTPGHACPRGELATLLWGDTGDAQARQSLRQALKRLRTALGARNEALRIDGDLIALDPKAIEVDAITFERLIADGGPADLERAITLYRGELLAGLDLDEEPFEAWLVGQRERLRERALWVAVRLLSRHAEVGAADDAVRAASRVLAIDPLHERAHRALMRFHTDQGRRPAALRQYQACVDVLQRELGVEPEAETKQLYQEIVRERAAPAVARRAAHREARHAALPEPAERPAPLIGRDVERARLGSLLDDATRGRGGLGAIVGEAGIGKTRLVSWMAETAAASGARVLVGRAYASEQIVPLGPWSDALRSGVAEDPDLFGSLDDRWRGAVTRLLPELRASWPTPIDDDPIRFFEGVVQLVTQLADARPLLVVLEDVHWADELSLRLLAVASRRLRSRRVVMVATAREDELADNVALREFLRDVRREDRLRTIALQPLSQAEIAALVRATAHLGDAAAVERLVARTWATSEGHPFMALETIHALEQGTPTSASTTTLARSERVRDIVTGRLERISEHGQQLLAAAAVIGRDFEFPLLERAAALGEVEAAAGVEELVRRRVLQVIDERFAFTHDWIREVAYDQLLPPRRRLLHRRVAAVMETLYTDHLEPHFATLGRHWHVAGESQKAASYLHRAGRSAMERSAGHEAAASLQQALDALRRVPETQETLAEGIDIRLELWNALLLAQHIDRLSDLLEETQRLADQLGDAARRAQVSVLRSHYLWWTGRPREALALAREAQAIGERLGDSSLLTAATTFVWSVLQTSGDYRGVEVVVEAFKRQHDDAKLGRLRHGLHMFPYVSCRCHLAVAFGRRGQFDRAYANVEEARIVAEQADHRHSLIGAYWALGEVHITRGAVGEAVDALERALALCREWEVPLVRPACLSALGYTYVLSGRVEEGMSQLREALASMEIMGWAFSHSLAHIRLSEACLLAGRFPEALEVAQRALTLARERHERGFEARALRLHADIAVRREPLDVAVTEDLYRQTRALAAELDMQPLIGHVALGLALLYRRCARYEEARAHLTTASAVYVERDMPVFRERAEMEARALAAAERGST